MDSNDLIAGAWRNGLGPNTTSFVAEAERRYHAGFRQLPYESTVMELVLLLDLYDGLYAELATEDKPKKK